ncbi:MAG: type II toxin-antitoxin system HicA family toxin [Dehalococcoidia bacterium]|nr:MAG: type II toxin-antitoxin system HicA family toxin [Dehalococcoidia bacterium]
MKKLTPLKVNEVIRALHALGFEKVRQKGSHALFHHPDCRRAPIPVHPSKTISPYLLSDILKQLRISTDDFLCALE